MHLGSIAFESVGDPNDEESATAVTAATLPALQTAAALLGIEPAALLRAIAVRQIKVPPSSPRDGL